MRAIVWAGSGIAAAAAIVIIAVLVWRDAAPERPAMVAAVPPAAAPATPALPNAAAAPAQPAALPGFDVVSVAPDGRAVIAGRAMPGDHVTVLDGSTPIGQVTADARGEWVLIPDRELAPGNRRLSLAARGRDGGPARQSKDVVALTVNPPAAGSGAMALAVLLPGKPGEPARILQRSPPPAGEALTLDSVEYGEGDGLVLSGHADPGARLQIFAGDRLLGAAAADAAGSWRLVAARPAASGTLELRLAEIAGGGAAHAITAQLAPPAAPGGAADAGTYVVERGNSLWRIARHIYGSGVHYTEIYRVNRDRIRNPDLIFPGQHFTLPKS